MMADQTTERKFTRGPWVIDASSPHRSLYIIGNDVHVATVPFIESGAMTFANAKLIAAAPDLLEACAEAEKYISDTTPDGLGDMLRAAIAKAEGRS